MPGLFSRRLGYCWFPSKLLPQNSTLQIHSRLAIEKNYGLILSLLFLLLSVQGFHFTVNLAGVHFSIKRFCSHHYPCLPPFFSRKQWHRRNFRLCLFLSLKAFVLAVIPDYSHSFYWKDWHCSCNLLIRFLTLKSFPVANILRYNIFLIEPSMHFRLLSLHQNFLLLQLYTPKSS